MSGVKLARDPSTGKRCGRVCCVWIEAGSKGQVCYLAHEGGLGPVRTYHPGRVDGRYLLGGDVRYSDDLGHLQAQAKHGLPGRYVVPVEVASRLAVGVVFDDGVFEVL